MIARENDHYVSLRREEILKPAQIAQPLVGLLQFHQRGTGSGVSVERL